MQNVTKVMEEINKKYGVGSIKFIDEVIHTETISTSCLELDEALGGGVPKGRIIEFYGAESSGKAQPLSSKVLTPNGLS